MSVPELLLALVAFDELEDGCAVVVGDALEVDADRFARHFLGWLGAEPHDLTDCADRVVRQLELHEEKRRIGRRWVWIAVVVGVAAVAFTGWNLMKDRDETASSTPEDNASVVVNEPVREAVVEDTMIEWHKLELLAVARERTWLSVSIDGEPVADLTLEEGEQRQWAAEEYFQLDVGNGGGLGLYLDGEFLGTAGSGSRLVEGLVVNENGMSR